MSSKHLQKGDEKPAFDSTTRFRIYSMKFSPFAQVRTMYTHNSPKVQGFWSSHFKGLKSCRDQMLQRQILDDGPTWSMSPGRLNPLI